ncbi:MAG: aldehyde dehydrogenase family protein [Deltaproteobacteria bacterium]|nr:aldehyde dehydrogenase family protein [Deltaproteobacteria bacterium]
MEAGSTLAAEVNAAVLEVYDKCTGECVAELPIADEARVAGVVQQARQAQPAWAALPVRQRARLLRRARRELVAARRDILTALERETGKARFDVVGELMSVCLDIGHFARRAPRWLRPERVSAWPLFGKKGIIHYKPVGVVGVIGPWNAPLTLALGDAIPALLAGNCVVVKPSELTPLAVQHAVAAANRVLPPGVLQVVIGEGASGAALVDHADMVCVTGSPGTGRRVMERASRRLTPVLLELGGKDAMIVLADADLERAARGAAWGSCLMTGQVCMSIERIYVEAAVAESFKRLLVEQMRALRTGPNGAGAAIDFGPFTSARQVEIVERHIRDAVARGARVLTGGHRIAGGGAGVFFAPTVLDGVDHTMAIMREETFGPVVGVMAVPSAAAAVGLANESAYGLSASVWTRDTERGIAIAKQLETGSVCVNECVLAGGVPALPFGGVKQSGVGARRGGAPGVRQFCVPQAILAERRSRAREQAWFPYSPRRAAGIERLLPLLFRW